MLLVGEAGATANLIAVPDASATPEVPASVTPTSAVAPTSTPKATSRPTSTPPATATPVPTVSPNASSAIQAVIQRANDLQQQAFARNDPTIMREIATSDFYDELAKLNGDMAAEGVTAIELIKIEWGPITLTGATTASAITYETWQTTFSDGSSDQSREQNVYTLLLERGEWKISGNERPDPTPGPPTPQS